MVVTKKKRIVHKPLAPEVSMLTGYELNGEPIKTTRGRGRPPIIRNPDYFPHETKVSACALYCLLGHVPTVADRLAIPEVKIREWMKEQWWSEVQTQVMLESNNKLSSTINTVLDEALVMLEDRVVNGDCVYLPEKIGKDGDLISEEKTVRVPLKARDLGQIFNALTHQRQLMQDKPTAITKTSSTEEKLNVLLQNFASLGAGAKVINGECEEVKE